MIDNRLLLVKAVTLLYRESQLVHRSNNSKDLVRSVVESVQVPDASIGLSTHRDTTMQLKDTILEMCQDPDDTIYNKEVLLQRLRLNCGEDDRLYDSIQASIVPSLTDEELLSAIVNIQRTINNHFKEQKVGDILVKAAYQFKYHREKINNVNTFIAEVLGDLEPLQKNAGSKDEAIISELDIGDMAALTTSYTDVKSAADGSSKMKFGWQDLNTMCDDGIKRGEYMLIGALPHKNKTGFTLSLTAQIAMLNKPFLFNPVKTPLILRISFEDDEATQLKWIYQYLKHAETGEYVSAIDVDAAEIAEFVSKRLCVNGFKIKILDVDPNQWTYKHICNKVMELEAQGYEIHALILDYLFKLPTTGTTPGLPNGHDKRDMARRMRNFCKARKIALITPQQLGPTAKDIWQSGIVPEDKFVTRVANKGMWDSCKSLDIDADIELQIHSFYHNDLGYFAIQRGKHRGAPILEESKKFMILPYPKDMPIPPDIHGEKISMRKLPSKTAATADEAMFSF